MLWFSRLCVIVLEEECIDVPIHREAAGPCVVVPCDVYSCKFGAGPIRGDFIVVLQCREEVICMSFALVLDSEVVDDKDEKNWAPLVSPQSRCGLALVVSVCCQAFGEEVVC